MCVILGISSDVLIAAMSVTQFSVSMKLLAMFAHIICNKLHSDCV